MTVRPGALSVCSNIFVMPSYFIFVEKTPTPPGQAASAAGASAEQDVDKLTARFESGLTIGGTCSFY